MAKKAENQEKKYGAPADQLASDAYPAVTNEPDAKFYAVQPTSAELNVNLAGDVPAERFQEQVLKSEAGSKAKASHPDENQPAATAPERD